MSVTRGRFVDFGRFKTIIDTIDHVIKTEPSAYALRDSDGQKLSYGQMSDRVQKLCTQMVQSQCSTNTRVGVLCHASLDSVCSLLAIMRLGAVYIPLDLRNPIPRLSAIVRDSQPEIILYQHETADEVLKLQTTASLLNISMSTKAVVVEHISNRSNSEAVAFLMYTSGSSGTPKGIRLTHCNFHHQMNAVLKKFKLDKEVVLQQSCWGFDVSLFQVFCALMLGGALVIAEGDIRNDPEQLSQVMFSEGVTFTLGVPSEYSTLLRYGHEHLSKCWAWRFAFCGGERMTVQLMNQFRALKIPQLRLVNCYGPTEVSLAATYGELDLCHESEDFNRNISVGKVLPNYSVYIVDASMRILELGLPGEICIAGAGVAAGYLRSEKLCGRFFTDPFASKKSVLHGWNRLFRTGDRGFLAQDGSLYFSGRIEGSTQVKLRGNRIELDDVANIIIQAANKALGAAAVCLAGKDAQMLVAFVVFSSQHYIDNTSQYLKRLRSSLPVPPHMRPASIIALRNLPTTPNGKLDRIALQTLVPLHQGDDSGEISNDTERILKSVWKSTLKEVLSSQNINNTSDFFELGGNSLMIPKLRAEIRGTFGIDIAIKELFQATSLQDMALLLNNSSRCHQRESIDWKEEIDTALQLIKPLEIRPTLVHKRQGIKVVMTGATGFLGRKIIETLILSPHISSIDCLATRARHFNNRSQLPCYDSDKVQFFKGDLAQPLLGLSESEASDLAREATVIIHNGADVSFLKSYQSLRKANLFATAQLLRLSGPRQIPFHYISSAGISRLLRNSSLGFQEQSSVGDPSNLLTTNASRLSATLSETALDTCTPPSSGEEGYIASKWASEQLVSSFAEANGVPCFVHRPTSIVGRDAPSADLMDNLLRFSRKLQAVPDFANWDSGAFLDCVHVEKVVAGIVENLPEADQVGGQTQRGTRFVHHCAATKIPAQKLAAFLEYEKHIQDRKNGPETGPRIANHEVHFYTLPMRQWLRRAGESGMDDMVRSYFQILEENNGTNLVVPYIAKAGRPRRIFGIDLPRPCE